MMKVEAIFRPDRLETVSAALETAGYSGFTIMDVRGHGQSPEKVGEWRGQTYELHVTHKLQIEIIVEERAGARDPEDRDGNLPDLANPRRS